MPVDLDPVPDASPAAQEAERVDQSTFERWHLDSLIREWCSGPVFPAVAPHLIDGLVHSVRVRLDRADRAAQSVAPAGAAGGGAVPTPDVREVYRLRTLMLDAHRKMTRFGWTFDGSDAAVNTMLDLEAAHHQRWVYFARYLGIPLDPEDSADAHPPTRDGGSGAATQDTTWFWEIVDRAGVADVPSDERGALALLCERAARSTIAPVASLAEVEGLIREAVALGRSNPPGSDSTAADAERCGTERAINALRTLLDPDQDVVKLVDDLWHDARSAEAAGWIGEGASHDAAERKARVTRSRLLSAIAAKDAEIARLRAAVRDGEVGAELEALSEKASPKWCVYGEPDVGLPPSLFSGAAGQSDFRPIEPLQGYDLAFAVETAAFVRARIAALRSVRTDGR